MDDKIIVTNRSALAAKYGAQGLRKVRQALVALVAADKKRGIKSRVVYLDDKAGMKKVRGKPVTNARDPRQNKAAIDAVFKASNPDYLMILGAIDVVPHQDLSNPAFSDGDDDDNPAWGDLPYACDAPYSRDPAKFVGPTRVVGRVPDMVSAGEPSYLVGLLKTAAAYATRPASDYLRYFGLSAKVWQGSTRLSLNNIFGNATDLLLAPPSGPNHPKSQLKRRMHFINCHGGSASAEFQGQQGNSYPLSLTSKATRRKISDGSIAAVECCYGAQLYDAITLGIDPPICQSYLGQGAYGYLGSTTIAYGPADDNGAADLICQYFLLSVLDGASIGRATLVARQQYVANAAQMDAIDLKTLAQFCLLGDPSVHPVTAVVAAGVPKSTPDADAERVFRAERRSKLRQTGEFLQESKPTASRRVPEGRVSPNTKAALANIARLAGLSRTQEFMAFAVRRPAAFAGKRAKTAMVPSRYRIAIGTPTTKVETKASQGVAVVAKEFDGRIVGYRIYRQR